MAATFKMSRRAVGQFLQSPELEAEMLRRAQVIMSIAVATSPIGGPGDPHPGQYKGSWKVKSTKRGGQRRDRAVATVYNTALYARFVEYGTDRYPGRHVLLRAALAGGR